MRAVCAHLPVALSSTLAETLAAFSSSSHCCIGCWWGVVFGGAEASSVLCVEWSGKGVSSVSRRVVLSAVRKGGLVLTREDGVVVVCEEGESG